MNIKRFAWHSGFTFLAFILFATVNWFFGSTQRGCREAVLVSAAPLVLLAMIGGMNNAPKN